MHSRFLLVKFQLDYILNKEKPREAIKALKTLPTDMESAYNEVLIRMEKDKSKDIAREVLSWLFYSQRPLRLDELQEVLSIETHPPDSDLYPEYFMDPVQIIKDCQSLVEFDENSQIVRFSHYTVQEFLKTKFQDRLLSQTTLATVSLTYLTFDVFELGPCSDQESFIQRMKTYCFTDYAVRYWGSYVRGKGEEDEEVVNHLLRLFESPQKRAAMHQHELFIERPWDKKIWTLSALTLQSWTPLHVIAREGFNSLFHNFTMRHQGTVVFKENTQDLINRIKAIDFGDVCSRDYFGSTPLMEASRTGRTDVTMELLENGAVVNVRDNEGCTPLHAAVWHGHKDTAIVLLDRGADVKAKNHDGATPLHGAVRHSFKDLVILLLDKGADVNAMDNSRWTALHGAASIGHEDIVTVLLENGADVLAEDVYELTALDQAVWNRHDTVIIALLDKGAKMKKLEGDIESHRGKWHGIEDPAMLTKGTDVETQGDEEETALHRAASDGHIDVVKILLEKGVNLNAKDGKGRTPLHCAALKGHKNIVVELLERGAEIAAPDNSGLTALHSAASHGHKDTVMTLLDGGADVNARDDNGWTPLHGVTSSGQWDETRTAHSIALTGYTSIVKALLNSGADVKAQSTDGWTPLHGAAAHGHKDMVNLLIDGGADIDARDSKGSPALHGAAWHGYIDTVMALLDHGADVHAQRADGWTALHGAAATGHNDVVMALLINGADVNASDANECRPLRGAACHGHKDIVMKLLEYGADIDAQDEAGETALHRATLNEHTDIVIALLENGADANIRDNNGYTALHLAAQNANKDIVTLLFHSLRQRQNPLIVTEVKYERPPFSQEREAMIEFRPELQNRVDILTFLSSIYPHDHIYPRMLGNAFWEEKLYSDAIKSFEISIQLDPLNDLSQIDTVKHGPVICDDCRQDLIGIRYRCAQCEDFDLCSECYNKPTQFEHPMPEGAHQFFAIPSNDWKQNIEDIKIDTHKAIAK